MNRRSSSSLLGLGTSFCFWPGHRPHNRFPSIRSRLAFNFPYNASTPELEKWLPTQVLAFRTGGQAINPLPHKGQAKLTCISFGPGNCEAAIDREIEKLLAKDSGWLIFNTRGLDDEGWGPIRASYLERLLERLIAVNTVEILPAGKALAKYVS